ncbi:uncharacterized protein Tco025E_03512 [Trypanosoma conorhini]|uniref:Uncharacterized protein n=1 Tax=Trypanosoma conorhini TaxID=83891 RepID=A0A422PTX3_9TRYP|nr:uncharacterized protein Tco025E_03512 [Trypanosoma conorhini]RNF21171.1 hypothetical protein Tco025E_03512 [Trypanosoma conorhini]
MSHVEHLGIAFANIVYAFLITIDTDDFEAFICRMFERESREKRVLIAFLMKKRAAHFPFVADDVRDAEDVEREGNRCATDGEQDGEWQEVKSLNEMSDAPVVGFLERNMAINDVVAQLTVVRNAFLECILGVPEDGSFAASTTLHRSLQQIPNVFLNTAMDGVEKTIMEVVSSLCGELKQKYPPNFSSHSLTASVRGLRSDLPAQWDRSHAQMLGSAVELIWAYSLAFIFTADDFARIRCGGFVKCSRFLLRDLYRPSVGEATTGFRPSLCNLPPVFFLSLNLAVMLENHFYDVLSSGGLVTRPSDMHLLLLSRLCYGFLSQLDEASNEDLWRGLLNTCVSVMKEARRSSQGWEDLDWGNLIQEVDPSHATADPGLLVQELVFIWRRQQGWWGTSTDGVSQVTDKLCTASLPIFLMKCRPVLFSYRFKGAIDVLSELCGLSRMGGGNKSERAIVDHVAGLFSYAVQLCHTFTCPAGPPGPLHDLFELLRGMVLLSKRERRLKEVVTLVLSGCLLSQSAPYGASHASRWSQEWEQTEKLVDGLLEEVDSWHKAKHAICYSLSLAALLGRCSLKELERRLPKFFATMESWFVSANDMERTAILHATLHAGGLLCDVCASHDLHSPCKWNKSIMSFFGSVEKVLQNVIGSKGWKDTPYTYSCIEIASDLLLFALQQEPFQSSALHWLLRLLDAKAKTRVLSKSANGTGITRGRLIAIRTMWALFELYNCGTFSPVVHQGSTAKDILLASTTTGENRRRLGAMYNAPLEQKSSIKERIIGFIALQGTCYRPVVATVEALAIFWRGGSLRNVICSLKTQEEVRQGINELREAAFSYARQLHTNERAEDIAEYTHQLVPIFMLARFWDPPQVLLECGLVLPKLLMGPKTPLYEVVANVVFPFYLLKTDEKSRWSSALALYRLVECIIVELGNDEVGRVARLVEYVRLHLSNLRDRMESLVNEDLYAQKAEGDGVPSCSSIKRDSFDREEYKKTLAARRAKWAWLLDVLEVSPLRPKELGSSQGSQDWCAVQAICNIALIDLLEGLAVALLGHTKLQVRRTALFLLELVSSLLRLQRLHCGGTARVPDNPLLDGARCSLYAPLPSAGNGGGLSLCTDELISPRVAVADIFGELGEQFEEMYVSNKERYVPLAHVLDRGVPSLAGSLYERFAEETRQGMAVDDWSIASNSLREPVSARPAAVGPESTLVSTSFGAHCLSEDGTTPHFVFVSTTALALLMYGYRPGSALVRAVCAIAGEVVERGSHRQMERNSSVWESCYVLRFLLLCVDNVKSSPDANRLTRGGERNRAGHQQGGNSTFAGRANELQEVNCYICNRHAAYQHLMEAITVPLLVHEISADSALTYFVDMMQYLLLGPMEYVATGSTSLVTYCGIMDSKHPILVALLNMLIAGGGKTRRAKQTIVHICYAVLLPMVLVISRRYFLKPPFVPGWKQNTVATQRAEMETILQGVIDGLLLGEPHSKDHAAEEESGRSFSVEALSRIVCEGNGVSVRSCLSLPSLSSVTAQSDGRSMVVQTALSDVTLRVFLRGILCDVIALVYSKDAKFLEPHFKGKFLTKVLYSLTYQVRWFLQGNARHSGRGFGQKLPRKMNAVMDKSIFALQTVVSSLEQPTLRRGPLEHACPIINTFGITFFQWLQESLPIDCKSLETHTPSVFGLAVTLLVADAPLRDSVIFVLRQLPLGSPVHRTFFSIIVTACTARWGGRKGPMLTHRCHEKAYLSCARSVTSNDAPFTYSATSWRSDVVGLELKTMGSIIYYALVYLYKDERFGYFFDPTVQSRAYDLLVLLCGEAPIEPMADPLDDWLCLLMKTYRQGSGEGEAENGLVQYLFLLASEDILSTGCNTSSALERQRIALSLLSFFLRRVQPTESNLRTVLSVTHICRNTSSELALATLWGGWIAYEGRERELFVSILVGSPMDLADKRLVTHYIDSYINHEMTLRGKGHDGKLDGRSRGAYYSFLLFSLYQMRLLRDVVTRTEERVSANMELAGESHSTFAVPGDGCGQSFLACSSTSPSPLNSPTKKKRR